MANIFVSIMLVDGYAPSCATTPAVMTKYSNWDLRVNIQHLYWMLEPTLDLEVKEKDNPYLVISGELS